MILMASKYLSHSSEKQTRNCDWTISYGEYSFTVKHGITASGECSVSGELIVAREIKKFPAVHPVLITVLVKCCHSFPPWATYIQSIPPPPTTSAFMPSSHPRYGTFSGSDSISQCKGGLHEGKQYVVGVTVNVRAMPALFLKVRHIR
jgi:hypothetical protein